MNDSQLTTADCLFIVLVGGAIALALWVLAYSLSWMNRRVSLSSLLVLLLMMAIVFALLSMFARNFPEPPPNSPPHGTAREVFPTLASRARESFRGM